MKFLLEGSMFLSCSHSKNWACRWLDIEEVAPKCECHGTRVDKGLALPTISLSLIAPKCMGGIVMDPSHL